MGSPSKKEVVAAAQAIAQRLGIETLRRKDFAKESGFSLEQVYRLFPNGGWRELLEAAQLKVDFQTTPTPDDVLLQEFHRVVTEIGGIPTGRQVDDRGDYSYAVYKKRFGGIQNTLKRYRAWLEQTCPDAPELALVDARSKHEVIMPKPALVVSSGSQEWNKNSGTVFGAPISFRGLRHAPINEQGVVYLFGMVSEELGLIVEAVQSAYPDCEAKRCVDTRQNRWQRVRIEFEFRGSDFVEHGHDPAACDMIVCWEHDWPECPLEVVELRTALDQLEG